MTAKLELSGKVFHFLKVLEPAPPKKFSAGKRILMWRCQCVCGKICRVPPTSLANGIKKSCGCKNFASGTHGNRGESAQTASLRAVWNSYYQKAKRDKQEWSLTPEQVFSLITAACSYCGRPPSRRYNVYFSKSGKIQRSGDAEWAAQGWVTVNGIDRVANELGYALSNVVTACSQCNYAKHDQTLEDFKSWISALILYQNVKMKTSDIGSTNDKTRTY